VCPLYGVRAQFFFFLVELARNFLGLAGAFFSALVVSERLMEVAY